MPPTPTPLVDKVPDTSRYENAVARAKRRAAAQAPVPPLSNTPSFDSLERAAPAPTGAPPPPSRLSDDTAEGLQRLMAAQEQARTAAPAPAAEAPEDKEPEDKELTEDEKLKVAIEKRLKPIDVGQHLMGSGEVLQRVPIIPGKLEPVYRTVSEYEEGWVDAWIRKQGDGDLSGRQYNRLMTEISLAFAIHTLGGQTWPPTIDKAGRVIDDAVEDRLIRVRKLSATVTNFLALNMGWFIERVNKALTAEALGNG